MDKRKALPLAGLTLVALAAVITTTAITRQSMTSNTQAAEGCRKTCKNRCDNPACVDPTHPEFDKFSQCMRDCEEGKDPAHPEDYNMGPDTSCFNDCVNKGGNPSDCASGCAYYRENGCWPNGQGGCVAEPTDPAGQSPSVTPNLTPKPTSLTPAPSRAITPIVTNPPAQTGGYWKLVDCHHVNTCVDCRGANVVCDGGLNGGNCCTKIWVKVYPQRPPAQPN